MSSNGYWWLLSVYFTTGLPPRVYLLSEWETAVATIGNYRGVTTLDHIELREVVVTHGS